MDKHITVVIIENDLRYIQSLTIMLNELPFIRILGSVTGVKEGVGLIMSERPDLVFLDIELNGGTGFDVLNQVDEIDFEVIFTTAYENYAIDAIKLAALD